MNINALFRIMNFHQWTAASMMYPFLNTLGRRKIGIELDKHRTREADMTNSFPKNSVKEMFSKSVISSIHFDSIGNDSSALLPLLQSDRLFSFQWRWNHRWKMFFTDNVSSLSIFNEYSSFWSISRVSSISRIIARNLQTSFDYFDRERSPLSPVESLNESLHRFFDQRSISSAFLFHCQFCVKHLQEEFLFPSTRHIGQIFFRRQLFSGQCVQFPFICSMSRRMNNFSSMS